MTREEAIEIIRKEYACVDADCDIERNCGRCELHMPSKEPILKAYEMAISALEQEPLENIRAEIASHIGGCGFLNDGLDLALEIIDKHIEGR